MATTRRLLPGFRGPLGAAGLAVLLTGLAVPPALARQDDPAAPAIAEADAHPPSRSGSYLAARHAETVGATGRAARYYAELLALDETAPDILRRAMINLVSAGRIDEALPVAETMTSNGQAAALAGILRAAAAVHDGDPEAALKIMERPLTGSFGELVVPMVRAWIHAARDDFEAALAALDALPDREEIALFRSLHAAMIHDVAGNREKAETAYIRAMAVGETPAYRVVQGYASFLARHGKTDEARAILEGMPLEEREQILLLIAQRAVEQGEAARPMVATAADGLAEALFEVATALRRENAQSAALFLAQLAVHLRPGFEVGHILVAELFDDQRQAEAAIDSYGRIPPGSPVYWPVRVRVAEVTADTGRVDEAVAELEKVAEARPDWAEPLVRMGHILRGEERFAEAADAYDRALARIGDLQPHHWSLLYTRGIALERSKQWARAEADFLRALEFQPDQPYVLNYLGYSWVDQGVNLDRAKAMIEKAVELRPRDGFIVDSLGWALYRLGDYQGAVGHLERAVELRPEDPVINDHLGDAYWKVGRHREARFQWRRALSLEPEETLVAPIRDKLRDGLADTAKGERDS